MIARLENNRVRRTYLGGGRIDAFVGSASVQDGALRPEDWLASTVTAYNGAVEIDGEGLGRLEDSRTAILATSTASRTVRRSATRRAIPSRMCRSSFSFQPRRSGIAMIG